MQSMTLLWIIGFVRCSIRTYFQLFVAERSKALGEGSTVFRGVGSSPTEDIYISVSHFVYSKYLQNVRDVTNVVLASNVISQN